MTYDEAVAGAPPGWRMYELSDVDRLPSTMRRKALETVPVEEMRAARSGDAEAAERVRRALFWTFVYQLRPDMWEALASAEPIHPGVLRLVHELGADRGRVLEICAGSGRLTEHLASASRLVALDSSLPLLRLLASKVQAAMPVVACAEALPVPGAWADVAISCASIGTEQPITAEIQRATRPGGLIVLINPDPLDRSGWNVEQFDPHEVALPARPPWIEQVFGLPDPPSRVIWRTRVSA